MDARKSADEPTDARQRAGGTAAAIGLVPLSAQDEAAPRQLLNGWLRRHDESAILHLLAAAALSLALYYLYSGGLEDRLLSSRQLTTVAYGARLDLNACDWPELCLLPGVSETLARRIVRSRDERGPYRCLADLQRVRGIGPKKAAALTEQLWPFDPFHGEPPSAGMARAETTRDARLRDTTRLRSLE